MVRGGTLIGWAVFQKTDRTEVLTTCIKVFTGLFTSVKMLVLVS